MSDLKSAANMVASSNLNDLADMHANGFFDRRSETTRDLDLLGKHVRKGNREKAENLIKKHGDNFHWQIRAKNKIEDERRKR